jgi:protein-L-isoaspartate(D-aspartate) O-methyltransferase
MLRISTYKLNLFKSKRYELANILREKGINNTSVIEAIAFLPRELFVHQSLIARVYEDTALPIDFNQTISQPYTVAYMTELLDVKPDQKILEIGTGSGYQACILELLGAKVYSIERIDGLYRQSKALLEDLDSSVSLRLADGTLGWTTYQPYDKIIITAAAPEIPVKLISQLVVGGKMIVPVGDKNVQSMHLLEKIDEESYLETKYDNFKFVPLIGRDGWTE